MTYKTITGLYDTYDAAAATVREIEATGVPKSDLSIVANNTEEAHVVEDATNAGTGAGVGTAVGTVVGGGAGLLAGLGILAIPGVGPVVAAGWLAATALGAVVGAGAGAATGGLVGSLTSAGVDEDHAHVYAEGVRRGGSLMTARVDESRVVAVQAIIDAHHPVDPEVRGSTYRGTGWKGFDDTSKPYTPSDLKAERALQASRPVL